MRVLNGIRFQKTLYQYENLTRWCNKDKFMSIEIKHVLRLKKKKKHNSHTGSVAQRFLISPSSFRSFSPPP